ncbi:HAMP domain-containing sensor histidine kinase [Marinilabiliaceae bacterium ANBcel2]|nr:HAMP domain-containing sensor histidine kinase [Marinilabiliaceae bacterium ANBcel2]
MRIRVKLTFIYSIITVAILLFFASVIYYSSHKSREEEFYTALEQEAITKANLFFIAQVDSTVLQTIYRSNIEVINEVEVAIYDPYFNLLYHDAEDIDHVKETPAMIDQIIEEGNIRFYQNDWQVIGVHYKYGDDSYVITATSYDIYGYSKLADLKRTILMVFIFSIVIIVITGYYFSRKAFSPVRRMINKVEKISASSLDLRVYSPNNKDELALLADTFNNMLDRLESSFNAQKEFVSNISHELRTPLTAIITELDLALNNEKDAGEYKEVISNALSDARRISTFSANLLDFAKAGYDPREIHFEIVRCDEIILEAVHSVTRLFNSFNVDLRYDDTLNSSSEELLVYGNNYLLKTAFEKIIENGCKYSEDNKCEVVLRHDGKTVFIDIIDKGAGIDEKDIENIFTPFFRGSNHSLAEGSGIGLPLAQRIINLHNGTIVVESTINKGSLFIVSIPLVTS